MEIRRRRCREISIGKVKIGGNNPVAVQSMVKSFTSDLTASLKEINQLQAAGVQIVRLAVRNGQDAASLKKIKSRVSIPVVADIHFDKNLAIQAIESGVDKIRLNPGNIYNKSEVREIARAAKQARIPIRVGVNSGSLRNKKQEIRSRKQETRNRKQPLDLARGKEARLMVKSALDYIKILEGAGFCDIVISLKSSDIITTIEANEKIAKACNYPLHLGITASGPGFLGRIKSAIVIGRLLSEGIGDTIRVSLTERAVEEVKTAFYILEALGLSRQRPQIISCPTCGRCEVDLVKLVGDLEAKLAATNYKLSTRTMKLAVMGCVVNGPGEAREADLGIAFGKKEGLLFRKGKPIGKIRANKCIRTLLNEVKVMASGGS